MATFDGDYVFNIRPKAGEPYELSADSIDIRDWERRSPRNTLRKLAENPSMDDCYSLAYVAARNRDISVPSYEDWTRTVRISFKPPNTTSASFSHAELVTVIDKAISDEFTSETIADYVMNFLETLHERSLDPTRSVR